MRRYTALPVSYTHLDVYKRQMYKKLGVTNSGESVRPGFFGAVQYGAYTVKYWVDYTVAVSYTHLVPSGFVSKCYFIGRRPPAYKA